MLNVLYVKGSFVQKSNRVHLDFIYRAVHIVVCFTANHDIHAQHNHLIQTMHSGKYQSISAIFLLKLTVMISLSPHR